MVTAAAKAFLSLFEIYGNATPTVVTRSARKIFLLMHSNGLCTRNISGEISPQ